MYADNEINVLSDVYEAIKGLDHSQVKRIVDWITSKFGLEVTERKLSTVQLEVAPAPPAEPLPDPGLLDSSALPGETLKKRRGRKPKIERPVVEDTRPWPDAEDKKGFLKFESFEDLFFSSNARTLTAKILLAAAYLQENKKLKEYGSSDINALMKKIGQYVPNISASINILMQKEPKLILQKGKAGTSRQARRAYEVSAEGLQIARNYIKE